MDRAYIEEHNVMERYLTGQLSLEERDAFEERLLWCAETRRDLQMLEQMQAGLRAVGVAESEPTPAPGLLARLARLFSPQLLGAAAVAGVAMAVTLLIAIVIGQDETVNPGAMSAAAVLLDGYRSGSANALAAVEDAEQVRVVDASAAMTLVAYPTNPNPLTVYLERNVHAEISTRERLQEGWQPLWQGDVQPGPQGAVSIVVPGSLLQPGFHQLRFATREAQPRDAGRMLFQVVE